MRVPRSDLERFRQGHASNAPAPASSVLQNRRERVEELGLEAQELRAKREIEKLPEEQSEAKRARRMENRTQVLAERRGIEETQLQRERDTERRHRERRQAEAERQRTEFSRRWLRWASNALPDWVTTEQEQSVTAAVEKVLAQCDSTEPDEQVQPALERAIERAAAPWRSEREERDRRERLIETAVSWHLPWGATDADKARVTASLRTALLAVPIQSSDAEVRIALDEALAPVKQSIAEREILARRERLIQSAATWLPGNAAETAKAQGARAVRSALSDLPIRASETEERNAATAAIAPIKQSIEVRTAAQQQQVERDRKKANLITFACWHISNYLDQIEEEIEAAPCKDFTDVKHDLETAVRHSLEQELTGEESQDQANEIAREIVEEEFGDDDRS